MRLYALKGAVMIKMSSFLLPFPIRNTQCPSFKQLRISDWSIIWAFWKKDLRKVQCCLGPQRSQGNLTLFCLLPENSDNPTPILSPGKFKFLKSKPDQDWRLQQPKTVLFSPSLLLRACTILLKQLPRLLASSILGSVNVTQLFWGEGEPHHILAISTAESCKLGEVCPRYLRLIASVPLSSYPQQMAISFSKVWLLCAKTYFANHLTIKR